MDRPDCFAQKRGQTPGPLWLESGFALPVGGQSPFLGKGRPIGLVLTSSERGAFRDARGRVAGALRLAEAPVFVGNERFVIPTPA